MGQHGDWLERIMRELANDETFFGDDDADARYAQRYPTSAPPSEWIIPPPVAAAATLTIPTMLSMKDAEDWVFELVNKAPDGLKALLYKQLYADGLRIDDCRDKIRAYEKGLKAIP